jgi:hypothetical protein
VCGVGIGRARVARGLYVLPRVHTVHELQRSHHISSCEE